MTRSDIRNQVRIFLGDTDETGFFTNTEVDNTINRVMPKLAADLPQSITFTDYATTAGQQRYSLPSNYLVVSHVDVYNHATPASATRKEKLTYADGQEFVILERDDLASSAEPEYYKVEQGATSSTNDPQLPGDLWLFPIPDDNGTNDYNVRFYYYKMPTALTGDTQIPELPEYAHMAIAFRSAEILAYKNGDIRLARDMKARGDQEIFEVNKMMAQNQRDRPNWMKDVMNYTDWENDTLY